MLGSMDIVKLRRQNDITFIDVVAMSAWVLVLRDENDFVWTSDHIFTCANDACNWGEYLKEELRLCVHYRAVLLRDIITSSEIASIIWRI